MSRQSGIEPGSTAWNAAMLTTIPPTLHEKNYYNIIIRAYGHTIILEQLYTQLDFAHSVSYKTFTSRLARR